MSYEDHPALYADQSNAAAPAGSVVAYRPDVYHRSVDHTDLSRYRVMILVSFRHRDAGWGGYLAWPFLGSSPELTKYGQGATPRQLALLGVPLPGHPYWGTSPRSTGCRRAIPVSTCPPGAPPGSDLARAHRLTPQAASPARPTATASPVRRPTRGPAATARDGDPPRPASRPATRRRVRPGCSSPDCR